MSIIIGIIVIFVIFKFASRFSTFGDLLTLEEYLIENPDCKTNHGIKCCHCDASSIKNWGKSGANDTDRYFICNHCGETLYRSDTVYTARRAKSKVNVYQKPDDKNPWES